MIKQTVDKESGRIGFMLDEELSDKFWDLCLLSECSPYELLKNAIDTMWAAYMLVEKRNG